MSVGVKVVVGMGVAGGGTALFGCRGVPFIGLPSSSKPFRVIISLLAHAVGPSGFTPMRSMLKRLVVDPAGQVPPSAFPVSISMLPGAMSLIVSSLSSIAPLKMKSAVMSLIVLSIVLSFERSSKKYPPAGMTQDEGHEEIVIFGVPSSAIICQPVTSIATAPGL